MKLKKSEKFQSLFLKLKVTPVHFLFCLTYFPKVKNMFELISYESYQIN